MPRRPECTCGQCRACKQRPGHRRHYQKHREQEIARAATVRAMRQPQAEPHPQAEPCPEDPRIRPRKRRPVNLSAEVSDEELDRRAAEILRREDAR